MTRRTARIMVRLAQSVVICLAAALAGIDAAADPSPDAQLVAHLEAMGRARALKTQFICEKRLQAVQTPLVSSGVIWTARPDSVRFTTGKPYYSDVILHDGFVLTRTQHRPKWERSRQVERPGLSVIMSQMAGWSMGQTTSLKQFYDVSIVEDQFAPPPATQRSAASKPDAAVSRPSKPPTTQFFALKPKDKALADAVREIRLVVDSTTHTLRHVEIRSAQGDVTRYWFTDIQLDPVVAPGTFTGEATP